MDSGGEAVPGQNTKNEDGLVLRHCVYVSLCGFCGFVVFCVVVCVVLCGREQQVLTAPVRPPCSPLLPRQCAHPLWQDEGAADGQTPVHVTGLATVRVLRGQHAHPPNDRAEQDGAQSMTHDTQAEQDGTQSTSGIV